MIFELVRTFKFSFDISLPLNSSSVFDNILAQSNATFPFPIITTLLEFRLGDNPVKSGLSLYHPTNSEDPITPFKNSPLIFRSLSFEAPVAIRTAS